MAARTLSPFGWATGWWVAALAGCGGAADVAPPDEVPAPAAGWVADVVREPQKFAALMDSTRRDGWIAYHSNDLNGAVVAFGTGTPEIDRARARVELDLGVLHADLARLQRAAHARLFDTWDRRGTMPQNSAAPAIAALSARCADEPWKPWADRVQAGPGAAFLFALGRDDALFPSEAPGTGTPLDDDPFMQRRLLHTRAKDGDIGALMAVATVPLVVEPADGFQRTFYDPCLHQTLSAAWLSTASRSLGGEDWRAAGAWAKHDGLAGTLFAPWLTPADLEAEVAAAAHPGLLGATMPSLAPLGLRGDAGAGTDDLQQARDEARRLSASLDRWKRELRESAGEDGRALLVDLQLIERFRQSWLLARARLALSEDRPRQALAFVQLARDVTERGVGPDNSPAVLALLAEAELRNGHTRESLDALELLSQSYPEVAGLKELVGDLAVLEGLDRRGDSKEN